MKEFDRLIELHQDFSFTWAAVNTAHHDAADLIASVQARLHRERTRNEERLAELQRTATDPKRSETVRRVAGTELARVRDCRYHANTAEVEAFKELIEQEKNAIQDLRKIQQSTRAAIEGAEKRIKEMRKDILGNQLADLAPSWPGGQEAEFAKLCEGVGYND